MEQPAPLDLAWMAGLWEGEGSFYIQTMNQWLAAGQVVSYRYVRAQMTMTDLDVLERFQRLARFGTVTERLDRGPAQGLKRQFVYHVHAQDQVRSLASWLYPLFGERRRAQVDAILAGSHGRLRGNHQLSFLPSSTGVHSIGSPISARNAHPGGNFMPSTLSLP